MLFSSSTDEHLGDVILQFMVTSAFSNCSSKNTVSWTSHGFANTNINNHDLLRVRILFNIFFLPENFTRWEISEQRFPWRYLCLLTHYIIIHGIKLLFLQTETQ